MGPGLTTILLVTHEEKRKRTWKVMKRYMWLSMRLRTTKVIPLHSQAHSLDYTRPASFDAVVIFHIKLPERE